MALRPGDRIIIQFADDEDELWHERLLASCVSGTEWVVVTPDDEVEIQDLSEVEVRFLVAKRRLPRGIRAKNAYMVYFPKQPNNDWLDSEVADFLLEGQKLATLERERRGLEPVAAKPYAPGPARRLVGKGPAALPANAPLPAVVDPGPVVAAVVPINGMVWRAIEETSDTRVGQQVPPPDAGLMRGNRGLAELGPGRHVFAMLTDLSETGLKKTLQSAHGDPDDSGDARTLPVKSTALGRG